MKQITRILALFVSLLILLIFVCACEKQENNETYVCERCDGKSMQLYTFSCSNTYGVDEGIAEFKENHRQATIVDYETELSGSGMGASILVTIKYYE